MAQEEKRRDYSGAGAGTAAVFFWFAGWLFTISYANLLWWKIILGLVVLPLFLGDVVG